MKYLQHILITLIFSLILTSCGQDNPKISHIVIKSDRAGVLLDTSDSSTLNKIEDIFYDKTEEPNAGPEFKYFIDITIEETTTRWQYSDQGFLRDFDAGFSMIYQLRDTAEFNRIAKIK